MSATVSDASTPVPPTKNAGSNPAIRANRIAAAAIAGSGSGRARNGPFNGVARSNCGSASAVAAVALRLDLVPGAALVDLDVEGRGEPPPRP